MLIFSKLTWTIHKARWHRYHLFCRVKLRPVPSSSMQWNQQWQRCIYSKAQLTSPSLNHSYPDPSASVKLNYSNLPTGGRQTGEWHKWITSKTHEWHLKSSSFSRPSNSRELCIILYSDSCSSIFLLWSIKNVSVARELTCSGDLVNK